jgi:hypothetical protein
MNRNYRRNSEQQILDRVLRNVNSYDSDNADAQSDSLRLAQSWGNPKFKGQFDVNILTRYFSVAAGVYTAIAYSAVPAPLQNGNLSAFIFGWSDFTSGYAKLKQQFPTNPWVTGDPCIVGRELVRDAFSSADATVRAALLNGDVVIPYTATSGGTNYVAYVIYRSGNVAYATLLNSLSSDTFFVSMLRYTISATAQQVQYNNAIQVYDQTLFGKLVQDNIGNNAFKLPEQNQNGIIDLPIQKGIDKNSSFAFNLNPIATDLSLSWFVNSIDKLRA